MISSGQDLVFVDTETTGFKDPRLIELAYQISGFNWYSFRCKPPIPIEEGATKVHGITDVMLKGLLPLAEIEQYPQIKGILEAGVIVAHNAQYDIEVLGREGIHVNRYIDTKELARKIWPRFKTHKLQDLKKYLEIPGEFESHSAVGDILLLQEVFKKMIEHAGDARVQMSVLSRRGVEPRAPWRGPGSRREPPDMRQHPDQDSDSIPRGA